jgi:photosystem II stability/assembly factor-like uncharacterized protein
MVNAHVMVGTRKAGWIYTADAARKSWSVSKPFLMGWSIYNVAADTRGDKPRLYAAANHWAWGPSVAKSDDGGETWDYTSKGLGFPQDMGVSIGNIWHVQPGADSEPGAVYAGTQPAGLFRSEDGGYNWTPVEGLNRHPDQPKWSMSGGGDSCLHSIEIDPRDPSHVYVAISTGGGYETKDGGKTWAMFASHPVPETKEAIEFNEETAKLFPAESNPDTQDVDPAALAEMHRVRIDNKSPDRLWTQTHTGVFLSTDSAKSWRDITAGLPSFHGFPIAVSRRAPDAAYVIPLAFYGLYANFRVCPGQLAVYRTNDDGKSWQALTKGLPGPDDYQSVYRDGLDTDGMDPEGVFFGTSNGEVYGSIDRGDTWQRLPGTLPPIITLACASW